MLAFKYGITVEHKTPLPIKVHQCLFGYEDGHRLLESSLQLPNDAESILLKLSDLAPGVNDFNIESYWTGFPLTSFKYYALLKTWPAPEMPRPGCVWTHVVLISFSDIARFNDLTILKKYLVRPNLNSQHKEYLQPILIDAIEHERVESVYDSQRSYENLLKVIRAVYSLEKPSILFADTDELDTSVFRVWSQQWPRLRRSFSFRTAGSISEKSIAGVDFDLRILPQSSSYSSTEEQSLCLESEYWEAVAIKDALSSQPTDFRRFLWRYGSDINKGRERFIFLADLYVSIHQDSLVTKSYKDILFRVAQILPEPEDGKALKSDLIEGESNIYSLIPGVDSLDSLIFFIRNPKIKGLSLSKDSTFSYLRHLWPTRSEEIIAITEEAINKKFNLRHNLLMQLVELTKADSFLADTDGYPNLRYSLITEKPSLLNSDNLLSVDQPELSKLLDLLPDDQQLAEQVIERLINLSDNNVSNTMFERFPNIVMQRVVDTVKVNSSNHDKELPSVWLQTLAVHANIFLSGGYIENLQSMKLLAIFADVLGYRNLDVHNAGPLPWASALVKANKDIFGKNQDKFYAFLLMIAIEKPKHGCELLFELTFEHLHSALAYNKLETETQNTIIEFLPTTHWWQQWDLCHRLRVAVVNAYVDNKLDKVSFNRLTNIHELADSLEELLRNKKNGRSYLKKKVSASKRKRISSKKKAHQKRFIDKI